MADKVRRLNGLRAAIARLLAPFIRKKAIPSLDPMKDRATDPPESYLVRLQQYCDVVSDCLLVSRKHGGVPSSNGRHYYASALFTALCTRAVSLAFIAPYSTWARRDFEHWDFASVANITRTILETRLNLFYLCIEDCTDTEWNCRWNMMNLHDCLSRAHLMSSLGKTQEVDGLAEMAEELRERLRSNSFFVSLPESTQREALKKGKAHLSSLEQIAARAGIEVSTFQMFWRLTSAQIHSLPMSFYRMQDNERGRGVQTSVEEGYTTLLLTFCMTLLVSSRDEFEHLAAGFSKVESALDTSC